MTDTSIILINYNGSADTVECLQSLRTSSNQHFNVFLIDNGSTLSTFEDYLIKIKNESKYFSKVFVITEYSQPDRTILVKKYFDSAIINQTQLTDTPVNSSLILIFNNSNTGFAAANNTCIRLAQKLKSKYYWLLNNDTIIEKNSLTALIHFSEKLNKKNIRLGLVGSKVLYYQKRNILQTVGGIFNPYTTRQYHKGLNETDNGQYDNYEVSIDYPYGAAIFFDDRFLNEVGLLNEKYFLYYEELDWAVRAKRKKFESRFCFESKVYHKQGNATGKKMNKSRSPFNTCLKSRNLLSFYAQHYLALLPVAWLRLLFNAIKSLLKNDLPEAKITIQVLFGFKNCFLIQQKKI